MKKNLVKIIAIIVLIIFIAMIYFYQSKNYVKKPVIGKSDEWLYKSTSTRDSSVNSKGSIFSGITTFDAAAESSAMDSNIGFSTGGAKNVENFRENIKNGYFPIYTDITYNGLFYDYSFDTGKQNSQTGDLFSPAYSTAVSKDIISDKNEYYMSVGLNSNIKESDFKRKKLNLVVVLDNSGSMSSAFNSYYYDEENEVDFERKSKMEIADKSVNILLDQLNPDDRFGMVVFSDEGQIAKHLSDVETTNIDSLKENILKIQPEGGTNFEDAYKKATEVFEEDELNSDEYQNRIIVLTDAMPNTGDTDSNSLMNMIEKNSTNDIYTSFVGIGVDFNTELIQKLGTVSGANYYSVHNEKEFEEQMGEDFDYMVTPLVFDLNLDFESEDYEIETVYGTEVDENNKENIMHVNTLFPSKRNDKGEVKGGIILLKLKKKNDSQDGKITLKVSYKDAQNQKHSNEQQARFVEASDEYYDNTGIRKAIVLTRYANAIKDWILYERTENRRFLITPETGIPDMDYTEKQVISILGEHERMSTTLTVSEEYKELFGKIKEYIQEEMNNVADNTLKQEIEILNILQNN